MIVVMHSLALGRRRANAQTRRTMLKPTIPSVVLTRNVLESGGD
ncbi:hypothetical protein [Burkholderia sp. BCC0322]|nr:hypothetical protein [Burkholderia sp. BCC0322]